MTIYKCLFIKRKEVNAMKIGDKIRKRRIELNITLDTLSEKTGIGKAHLSRVERNEFKRMTPKIINKLALGLEVPLSWFDGLENGEGDKKIFILRLKEELYEEFEKLAKLKNLTQDELFEKIIESTLSDKKK